jgi:choline dehydrogenase-like flavoprotein
MTENSYDVIIIGGGVMGALCAWKLTNAGRCVLILEAADQAFSKIQREEFREVMVPNTNRGDMHAPYAALASRRYPPSPEAAGKPEEKYYDLAGPEMFKAQYVRIVGGSTWTWRGNTPRFVPNDFQLKTAYGKGDDWPMGYKELEPYYVQAENHLGVAGDHKQWDDPESQKKFGQRSKPFPMKAIPLSYGDELVKKEIDGRGLWCKDQSS